MRGGLPLRVVFAALLAGFNYQCSRTSSRQQEAAPEKPRTHANISKPASSAVGMEDALRGAFKPVLSAQELDPAVRDELDRRIGEPMAASGEPYQATDVVLDKLPTRRFVVAGVSALSAKFWVLCYEHGGIGHHHHIALFALDDGVASVRKAGQWLPGRARPVTLERVVDALRNDEQQPGNW